MGKAAKVFYCFPHNGNDFSLENEAIQWAFVEIYQKEVVY
jgi:hypothetical protein